jgi:multidrug resistance efflux pump
VRLEPFELNERKAEAEAMLAAKQATLTKMTAGFRVEEIAQARDRAAQAQATYERLMRGPRPQEIDAARASLQAAEAQLKFAKQSFERADKLYKDGSFPKTRYDEAVEQLQRAESTWQVRRNELAILEEGTRKEDLDAAKAKLNEATAALNLLEQGYRTEDVDAARAAVVAAEATVAAVAKRIDELQIKAPCNGVIQSIDLEPGDLVRPQTPVVSMLNTEQRWIRAYVPEAMKVNVGDRLTVTADPLPGEKFEAEVIFVAERAEFTPSNVQTPEERAKLVYRIKANLIDPPKELRRGLIVDVSLP